MNFETDSHAALLYAASTVVVEDTNSLLELILSRRADYASCAGLIEEWIGKAQYSVAHILHADNLKEEAETNNAHLPNIEGLSFSHELNESEQSIVCRVFQTFSPLVKAGQRRRT